MVSPRVKSVKGSVLDPEAIKAAIQDSDVVVLAFTPRIHSATWNQFVSINVLGVQNVLNAAQASVDGCAKNVVFISSTAVYDHYKPHCNVDETLPLPPYFEYQTAYDLTKRLGEDLVLAANGLAGVRTVALRPSGILIGPADYSLESILKHNVSAVEGASIDFTYGLNVCHAVVLAASALSSKDAAKVGGKALIISKGKPVSPGQLARDMDQLIGPKLTYVPPIILHLIFLSSLIKGAIDSMRRPAESVAIPTHRFLAMADLQQTFNNDLAKELLGFEPLYSYEDGMVNIACEHLENLGREGA